MALICEELTVIDESTNSLRNTGSRSIETLNSVIRLRMEVEDPTDASTVPPPTDTV